MASSQPIALPIVHANPDAHGSYVDYNMNDGSYQGSGGMFNPASYTRHFLGSPISWRPSSLTSASFTHKMHVHGSIDSNDMRYGRMSSSLENRDPSLLNALNLFDREGELCRNYTCCGLQLNDLHALLEHFETVHIVVVNGDTQSTIPFNPTVNPIVPPMPTDSPAAFDPDDMELELDLDNSPAPLPQPQVMSNHGSPTSDGPSPPDTPLTTPLSVWPSPRAFRSQHVTPAPSQPPSPRSKTAAPTRASSPVHPSALRPNLSLNLGASAFSRAHAPSPLTNPEDAFNTYARFSQDYSSGLPGAQFNAAPADEASMVTNPHIAWQSTAAQQQTSCVPPALLFSNPGSAATSPTQGGSRVPSPSGYAQAIAQAHAQQLHQTQLGGSISMPTTPISSTSPSRHPSLSRTSSNASPSLLLSKPFKCPKPNCNKSYKQANGLKYHMTHGSCNFAPAKDLEHVKDLLERKKRERERERERDLSLGRVLPSSALGTPNGSGPATPTTELAAEYGITEMDLREVEREAEKRLRPFACGVGDCQRRYKNMNGLRYHYQHSGEHGAQGLALLASGQHECLQGAKRGHHTHSHGGAGQNGYGGSGVGVSTNVGDDAGKKRLVIRPMGPAPQPSTQLRVQQERSVPVMQGQQAGSGTQIHVTPVMVTSPQGSPAQGTQQQISAVYAGQYATGQPNPYAYACYTPSTQVTTSPTPSAAGAASPAASTSTTSPYQPTTSASGYFTSPVPSSSATTATSNISPNYLGMMANVNASGGYKPTQAQLAAFHAQLKEQYREYAQQVQMQAQQAQQQQLQAQQQQQMQGQSMQVIDGAESS